MAITPLNLPVQTQELQGRSNERASPDAKSTSGSGTVEQATLKFQDTVKLSETAQSIKGAERKLADTPEVNQEKVDRLRAAIESGEYQVNAQRTAEGMMNFEQLFS